MLICQIKISEDLVQIIEIFKIPQIDVEFSKTYNEKSNYERLLIHVIQDFKNASCVHDQVVYSSLKPWNHVAFLASLKVMYI